MNRKYVQTSKRAIGCRRSVVGLVLLTASREPKAASRQPVGFTLVETLATIVVLAVLASVASFILVPIVAGHTRAVTNMQLHTELSMAMDRIERELRAIQLDPDALPDVAPSINSITPSSIKWHSNWVLSVVSGELRLVEDGGPPRVLLRDVTAFTIQAFDEANAPLAATLGGTDCAAVRRLQLSITIEREGATQTLRTKVFIRSTMLGS